MDEEAWDRVAAYFDEAILNVPEHDRAGLIREAIERYGGKGRTAADIGCGVGRALHLIAPHFDRVFATDISAECLAIAEKELARFHNISYLHADLSKDTTIPEQVDLSVCINTLLKDSLEQREEMLRHLCQSVKPGGHVLLVVPALESALYVSHRVVRLNRSEGLPPRKAQRRARREMSDIDLGIVMVDGVPTKHFLNEELQDMMKAQGLRTIGISRIEYPWRFVLDEPPQDMAAPMPWNWMIVAQRTEQAGVPGSNPATGPSRIPVS